MDQKLYKLFIVLGVVIATSLTVTTAFAGSGEQALMSAQYHESADDMKKAEQQYRIAASETGTKEKGIIGLTKVLMIQGETEEAGKILAKYVKDHPFSLEGRLALARYFARTGQNKKAEAEVAKVKSIRPGYSTETFREAKGDFHFGNKEYDKAIAEYSEAIRLEPSNMVARKSRSQAAMKLNRFDAAAADLKVVVTEKPADFESHILYGDALFSGRKLGEAEKVFQTAMKLDPTSALAVEKLAETYAKNGQYNKACDTYILATKVSSDPQHIAVRYGRYLVSQKQHRKAEEVFAEVLRVAPSNEAAAKELFWVYEKDGLLDLAGNLLSVQTQNYPNRTWAVLAYSKILGQVNRGDVAQRVLRRSVESGSSDTPDAHMLMGIAKVQGGNMKEAEGYFVSAAKEFPNDPSVQFNLGLFYEKQDKFAEAIKAYKNVGEKDSNLSRKAKINMAVIYEKAEHFEDAAEVLKSLDKKDNTVVAKIQELERKVRVSEQAVTEKKVQRSTASEKKTKTEEHSATEPTTSQ